MGHGNKADGRVLGGPLGEESKAGVVPKRKRSSEGRNKGQGSNFSALGVAKPQDGFRMQVRLAWADGRGEARIYYMYWQVGGRVKQERIWAMIAGDKEVA